MSDAKMPYGDVAYADPGYQKDGKKRYPLDSEEHCRAAWSYINQADNAAQYTPEQLASIKSRIRAAAKRYGIQIAETASRADDVQWAGLITRAVALDDAAVRSGRVTCDTCGQDATGRMVDAYAAVFGEPTEIHDEHGHYVEDIDPTAFNKRLQDLSRSRAGLRSVAVFFNHAKTVYDTPSERFSLPVGHPSAIRADGRGLLTSTHYTRNGEAVLQGITDGDYTGHSFTGRIVRSDPPRVPRVSRSGDLPRVRRLELGLTEYGATPLPYYSGAQLVGVRSMTFQHLDEAAGFDPPLPSGAGSDEPLDALGSAELRRKIRRALVLRSVNDGRQAH